MTPAASRAALLCCGLCLLLGPRRADAKYVEGHLVTPESWAFVARFCFLSDDGTFEYKIDYDQEYATQNLLLYYDSARQWPAVYKTNKTCEQKEAVLSVAQNQVVNLTELRPDSGCVLTTEPPLPRPANGSSGTPPGPSSAGPSGGGGGGRRGRKQAPAVVRRHILTCHNVRRFRSARERWWFLAISNCNASKGLNVHYRFLMTNGQPGDYWHEHFSADEFYILPTLMFFSICYLLMIIAIVMCTVELRSRQLLHATYKIFVSSVVLQSFGVLFQSIAYIRYAVDGVGFPRTRQLGRLMEAASETTFLLLLLLLAKGYTVTRGRLRVGSSIKLTIFMCLYVVTYVSLFIYEREFFDPGEVLYLFESPAGYGLMVLRIVAWWMFVYSTVFTLKHYPEKAAFYYPFNLLATLWFVAGPCFIMSANSLIDKWVRESVVYAVLHTIAFLGHLQFLVLTRPAKANKNFPFHVRTTQIAVMETVGVTGASSLYHFGHHNYAPGGPKIPATAPVADWMHEVPVGLFTVSRAVTELRTTPPALSAMPAIAAGVTSPPAATAYVPPPTYAAATAMTPPTTASSTAASLRLGADMAGGDARVADGREGSAGSAGSSRTPASPEPPRDTPRDPHMFLAPSQRALSSSGSSGTAMELKSRLGSAAASRDTGGGGGGGLQRGPGDGAPLDSMDATGSVTSRF